MCLPVLSALGTVVSAVGNMKQASAQASAYQQQAQIAQQNSLYAQAQAQVAAENGGRQEQSIRNKGKAVMGSQAADFGASGLDTGAGSPLDVLNDTHYQNELDALTARRNAANESWAYQTQATNYQQQANAYNDAAANAKTAGKWNAFSTILTGGTSLSKQYSDWNSVNKGSGKNFFWGN